MHPTWSIIIFTVISGLGFGMAAVLVVSAQLLSPPTLWGATIAAASLIIIGLASSTGHLANPKNAWRAVFRLRTSWLSREAVLAVLFFPLFIAWVIAYNYDHACTGWLAAAVLITAAATVFCTAMIYASLKPIRLWRHPLTPINYLLIATASGLWLVTIAVGIDGHRIPPPMSSTLLFFLTAAAVGKWLNFRRVRDDHHRTTTSDATGLKAARVRLLDTGHSAPNFLTREFVYHAPAQQIQLARQLALWIGFIVPFLTVIGVLIAPSWWWLLPLSTLPMVAGLLAERWLFFAEAQHVVRLYHGDERA